jgi:hypothetical protein
MENKKNFIIKVQNYQRNNYSYQMYFEILLKMGIKQDEVKKLMETL